MDNKQIKSFYLSLIDNPDAKWTRERTGEFGWLLFHCEIGDIKIESLPDYRLIFTYKDSSKPVGPRPENSEIVTFSEIGISKFRIGFPFFGICARLNRRVDKDEEKFVKPNKIKSVSDILSKDKVLIRDTKLNDLLK